ncbi:electron transport complex subunit RsxD [Photobacterium aquimaris]|uniref:Ion-translocating oxidoreductase complex subunit D n=1 Tax=Photobacterium aquimaris TaxID=512643 RepID=A0A2T3I1I4_9GAMM|nr:electron transport complex subunit RsxD [Photobacterium aquimaris]MCP4955529.1 electron transport complex subunit RsxD [Photobacterium aquimaris]OBU22398.1 electron transport complex subunit RsxD [Photobacterium aquimaris]PQJ41569.1 electron transport complex subunit RsxD [Photobacterium aquimaris]PSU10508.1 electron transport complex subunit RsxD [Photobacterium aquimaris]
MAFNIASSPHAHNRRSTSVIMRTVILCAMFGVVAQCYFFGLGTLIQIVFASICAIIFEVIVLKLRQRPLAPYLRDNTALLTGVLIGISIPPLAPWWITVIGVFFAIVIAKHLYGGMGQNLFNPAMVAYVVLLISFPVQMTTWLPPVSLSANPVTFMDSLSAIFTGFTPDGFSVQQLKMSVDGYTMATPLDTLKTSLKTGMTVAEAMKKPVYGTLAGVGWEWVNIGFLLGGLLLLKLRVIQWHIPVAMLSSLFVISSIIYVIDPTVAASPLLHMFSGATMLGAFFIATDPVTASTTIKGRLIFGAFIGVMIYLIRTWGGFPDGVAFAVLLGNLCVPIIDYYTRPRTYGH